MSHNFSNIIEHFRNSTSLSQDDVNEVLSKLETRHFKKGENILLQGEVCRHQTYVVSGCLKIFTTDDSGIEHINFFAIEDWWAIDLKSFISNKSSRYSITALMDTEAIQINHQDFFSLLENVPSLEKWYRIILQNALISSEMIIDSKSALNAAERYDQFLLRYPKLETKISQKNIASYLGITPEFLSMLKAKRWNNK